MMSVMSGAFGQLEPRLVDRLFSYRHHVFVERLGWKLETHAGLELDQFDREDTLYVIAKNDVGHINGCARLLPTERPYLLEQVFPSLMNGAPAPKSPSVWELSRFAAVDLDVVNGAKANHCPTSVASEVLEASMECARARGAERLITVSPLGIERLLRRMGVRARRAGPPMMCDGRPIFACWIELL